MRFKFYVLCLCFMSFFSATAQPVSLSKAQKVATRFLGDERKAMISLAYSAESEGNPAYFVFNAGSRFVVVAGDERCVPILAYSDQTAFYPDEVIPPVQMWLDNYQRQIEQLNNAPTSLMPNKMWQYYMEPASKGDIIESVEPLIKSKWGQGTHFNFFSPKDIHSSNNGRCVTGCVATALAQLIYYFRFPTTGEGSYTYQHEDYGTLSADFAHSIYDYNAMVDEPTQINTAISQLNYHCGVAVDMVYGPGASGMYNHKAAYALRNYFKYNPETKYIFRDSLGLAHDSLNTTPYKLNWDSVIVAHLKQRIPMYYAGWSVPWTDGHGFICDGYQRDADSNYYFHFNFGWNGTADGYFYTDTLYVGSYNFNIAQELIINAYPDTSRFDYPETESVSDTLNTPEGSLMVGKGYTHLLAPRYTHTWYIEPDTKNLQSIKLNVKFQLADGDSLNITSDDESLPLKSFSGKCDLTSFNYNYNGQHLVVRLSTSETDSTRLFEGSYGANYAQFCNTPVIRTGTQGTISDGSGESDYANCSRCQARIVTNKADFIQVDFTYFKTEKDHDVLSFYDANNDSLLLMLSGNNLEKTSHKFWTKRLLVVFDTDEQNSDEGWEFNYSAQTGIANVELESVAIYPNPTTGKINIIIPESLRNHLNNIQLYDMQGRLLKQFECEGAEQFTLSLSDFANGLYLIRIGNYTQKILKK